VLLAQCPRFLGPDPGRERQHDVTVDPRPGFAGCAQQRLGLRQGQAPAWPAGLSAWRAGVSAKTFRETTSLAWASLIARVSAR
jgi:hypothetical protein